MGQYQSVNTKNQLKIAKQEMKKPFVQEEELKIKLARLDEHSVSGDFIT